VAWQYFTESELRCKCCHACGMDQAFMERLIRLRRDLGFAFPVTSGYRCAAHNMKVSTTQTSAHTYGLAVDLRLSGERAYRVVTAAAAYGFTGIGVNQKGPHEKRFIHLDTLSPKEGPRPAIWSYP